MVYCNEGSKEARMQGWFTIRKSTLTDVRGTSYMIISINAEKGLDKIQHLLMI